MSASKFETWAANEISNGLIDIKFAVLSGKGISVELVQEELLSAEASIAHGFLKSKPNATSMIPDHIQKIINQTTY